MNTTTDWVLEIDPELERNARLKAGISAANDFLEGLTRTAPPPDLVRWTACGPAEEGRPKGVQLEMADTDGVFTFAFSRQYPSKWLLEPDSREISVLRVWGDLNLGRAKRAGDQVSAMLRQIEEEPDGPPNAR